MGLATSSVDPEEAYSIRPHGLGFLYVVGTIGDECQLFQAAQALAPQ